MTVSPTVDKKNLHLADQVADEGEAVPSYEEAVGGSTSATAAAVQQNAQLTPSGNASQSQRLYPFPSLGTQNEGYGQSPYQSDGTLRIVIAPSGAATQDVNATLLPLHNGQSQRRGPRAGRRFCAALFWALILYMLIGVVLGIVMDMDSDAMPPTDGPPGWHHHHGDKHGRRKAVVHYYERMTGNRSS